MNFNQDLKIHKIIIQDIVESIRNSKKNIFFYEFVKINKMQLSDRDEGFDFDLFTFFLINYATSPTTCDDFLTIINE